MPDELVNELMQMNLGLYNEGDITLSTPSVWVITQDGYYVVIDDIFTFSSHPDSLLWSIIENEGLEAFKEYVRLNVTRQELLNVMLDQGSNDDLAQFFD